MSPPEVTSAGVPRRTASIPHHHDEAAHRPALAVRRDGRPAPEVHALESEPRTAGRDGSSMIQREEPRRVLTRPFGLERLARTVKFVSGVMSGERESFVGYPDRCDVILEGRYGTDLKCRRPNVGLMAEDQDRRCARGLPLQAELALLVAPDRHIVGGVFPRTQAAPKCQSREEDTSRRSD